MLRRLLPLGLGLALCGLAQADPPPRVELTAAPAWGGWSRPGRATEIDVRLSADTATHVALEIVSGRRTLQAEVDLAPGRVARLHVPVGAAEGVTLSAVLPDGARMQREVVIARSESPLLGVALQTGEAARLEGFHSLALAADDLPRDLAAYAGMDALILDAATLAALDQRQLGALLAHAAGCGRIALLNVDARVRRLLDGAAACGGKALMAAATLPEATALLAASLATPLKSAPSASEVGEFARPGHVVWNRVALALGVYFAAAAMAVLFVVSWPVLLLLPALAGVAALVLLPAMAPPSQLVVWSEGDSGAQVARYQALQRFAGVARERVRVPIAPQLASSAQPCEPSQAMRFVIDASRSQASMAEFETRLFGQVSLCYSGSFPTARAAAIEDAAAGQREVRNAGATAWPPGLLLAGGLAHDLPALAPGARAPIAAASGRPPQDALQRLALSRTRPDSAAALWPLDLGGVADVPSHSKGWLLMSIASP